MCFSKLHFTHTHVYTHTQKDQKEEKTVNCKEDQDFQHLGGVQICGQSKESRTSASVKDNLKKLSSSKS